MSVCAKHGIIATTIASRAPPRNMAMPRLGYVLVVDDEPDIVDLIVDFLSEEGYAVRGALNSEEALPAINAQRPAVILLDLLMPHENGRGLWDQLRSAGLSDIPIVMMSASKRAAEMMLDQGVADYLAKPFDLDELLACVTRYVCRDSAPDSTYTHPLPA